MSCALVELPNRVVVDDYHEFDEFQCRLVPLIPGVKVREVGYSEHMRGYVGMVYMGNLKSEENKTYYDTLFKECID